MARAELKERRVRKVRKTSGRVRYRFTAPSLLPPSSGKNQGTHYVLVRHTVAVREVSCYALHVFLRRRQHSSTGATCSPWHTTAATTP